jgi:DNA polymerase III epsilon subunit-like protein
VNCRAHPDEHAAYTELITRTSRGVVRSTDRLAQHAYPGLASYSLDALLAHTRIPVPAGRHRALPDALVTAVLLQRVLTDGAACYGWSRLSQLRQLAGLPPPGGAATAQDALF